MLAPTDIERRAGTGEFRFTSATVSSPLYRTTEDKTIELVVGSNPSFIGKYFVSCHVNDRNGTTILQCDSRVSGLWLDAGLDQKIVLTIRSPWLKPGEYTVDLFVCTEGGIVDHYPQACRFEVSSVLPSAHSASATTYTTGLVLADYRWTISSGEVDAAGVRKQETPVAI